MAGSTDNANPEETVRRVLNAFMAEQSPIYIVGGAVRDHLLGLSVVPGWTRRPTRRRPLAGGVEGPGQREPRPIADLDLVLPGQAVPAARRVADRLGWAFYALDAARDVARIIGPAGGGRPVVCDAARLRGSLHDDLQARDFSANSLALRLAPGEPPRLIDLCGGVADVQAGLLRRVTPASLPDDPLRLLRAVRLSAQLGFSIESATRTQIRTSAAAIRSVSAERVRDELWKLLDTARPDNGIRELKAVGLLAHLLPELHALEGVAQSSRHRFDAFEHSLLAVRSAARLRDWLRGGPLPQEAALRAALSPWTQGLREHFSQEIAAGHDRAGWLVWHALLHDSGKSESGSPGPDAAEGQAGHAGHQARSARLARLRCERLRFSRREIALAERVAAAHSRPRKLFEALGGPQRSIARRDAYRYYRDVGSVMLGKTSLAGWTLQGHASLDGLDVALQAVSDNRATGAEEGEEGNRFLGAVESLLEYALSAPQGGSAARLVGGRDLMQRLGLPGGPILGTLLREIEEAQAAGDLADREAALAYAEEIVKERYPRALSPPARS